GATSTNQGTGSDPLISTAHSYSPWRTLKPTSWTPVIESDSDQTRAGLATAGSDVLGYHGYAISATWLVSGPDGVRPNAATPDWQLAYAYDRWRPTLFFSASNRTSFFAGPPTEAGTASNGTAREHQLEAGVFVPFRHVRMSHRALGSLFRSA